MFFNRRALTVELFFLSAGEFLTREVTENKRNNERHIHTDSNEHNRKRYMCRH